MDPKGSHPRPFPLTFTFPPPCVPGHSTLLLLMWRRGARLYVICVQKAPACSPAAARLSDLEAALYAARAEETGLERTWTRISESCRFSSMVVIGGLPKRRILTIPPPLFVRGRDSTCQPTFQAAKIRHPGPPGRRLVRLNSPWSNPGLASPPGRGLICRGDIAAGHHGHGHRQVQAQVCQLGYSKYPPAPGPLD